MASCLCHDILDISHAASPPLLEFLDFFCFIPGLVFSCVRLLVHSSPAFLGSFGFDVIRCCDST